MLETFIVLVMVVWVARALRRRADGRRERLSVSFDNARARRNPVSR